MIQLTPDFLFTCLVLGIATWRISSILVREDGPFMVFDSIRRGFYRRSGKDIPYSEKTLWQKVAHTMYDLLTCIWCTSVWCAAVLSLLFLPYWREWIISTFVTSALAIFIELVVGRRF